MDVIAEQSKRCAHMYTLRCCAAFGDSNEAAFPNDGERERLVLCVSLRVR